MAEETGSAATKNRFLVRNPEKADFNQYWYSTHTIEVIVSVVESNCTKSAAFLSTPSIYFSLKSEEIRKASRVFDLDEKWSKDPGWVLYDFNKPENIPESLHHTFDMVIIDPPFITREVWEKYAQAAKLLLIPEGKIVLTTIAENEEMMKELLDVKPTAFQPSIPHLVYQYNLYSNFSCEQLNQKNPEII